MPGELGYEDEQQGVGYYERRYIPNGEANTPVPSEEDRQRPNSRQVLNVIRKMHSQE